MRIVIPIKPLAQAKTRLSAVLSPAERSALAITLLDRALAAALAVAPVSVLTAEGAVAQRAAAAGADIIDEERVVGLNAAAGLAREHLRRRGVDAMLILAGDLPDVAPAALTAMISHWRDGVAVIAPSSDGGVNALALPTRTEFRFAYGPQSFDLHRCEAARTGLEVIVHDCDALRYDIDWPEDLARFHLSNAA